MTLVVGIAGAALLALAAIAACLPDLATFATPDAAVEAARAFQGCGDGIIATLDDGGDAGESCDPGSDAQVPGCSSTCQVECDGGTIDPATGHCYFAAGTDPTFQTANARCLLAKAHVITFVSQAEVVLASTLASSTSSTYWVGLVRSGTLNAYGSNHAEEPGFPLPSAGTGPCPGCFGVGADAGVFPPEQPDSGTTDCIAGTSSGWLAVACSPAAAGTTTSRATICEREPIGVRAQDCIGGFCFTLASTAGTKRYLVAVSATDPDTAALSCSGLGGSLVVFGSREEREQLAHEIRARYPDEVDQQLWIGLAEDGGAWRWEDGGVADVDPSRPLPWGNAQPPDASVAGARAYMHLATTVYDTQLAYADDGTKPARLYVCQRPVQ